MSEIDDGGPAFPSEAWRRQDGTWSGTPGLMLRDYFAARCPDSWVERHSPKTVGDVRDTLIARGIIPADRKQGDVFKSYDDNDRITLGALIRYDYADAMLRARKAGQ